MHTDQFPESDINSRIVYSCTALHGNHLSQVAVEYLIASATEKQNFLFSFILISMTICD